MEDETVAQLADQLDERDKSIKFLRNVVEENKQAIQQLERENRKLSQAEFAHRESNGPSVQRLQNDTLKLQDQLEDRNHQNFALQEELEHMRATVTQLEQDKLVLLHQPNKPSYNTTQPHSHSLETRSSTPDPTTSTSTPKRVKFADLSPANQPGEQFAEWERESPNVGRGTNNSNPQYNHHHHNNNNNNSTSRMEEDFVRHTDALWVLLVGDTTDQLTGDLPSRCRKLEQGCIKLRNHNISLQRDLKNCESAAEQQIEQWREEVDVLNRQYNDLQGKLKNTEGQLSALQLKHEIDAHTQAEESNVLATRQEHKQQAVIRLLEKDIRVLTERNRALAEDLQSMREELDSAEQDRRRLHKVEQSNKRKDGDISRLHREIQRLTDELEKSEGHHRQLQADSEESFGRKELYKSELQNLEIQHSKTIGDLQVKTGRLREELSMYKEKCDQMQNVEQKLRTETITLKVENEDLRTRLADMSHTLENLQQQTKRAVYLEAELKQSRQKQNSDVAKLMFETEVLSKKLHDTATENEYQRQTEVERVIQTTREFDEMQTALKLEKNRTQGLENELRQLLTEKQQQYQQLSELQADNVDLVRKVAEYEGKLQAVMATETQVRQREELELGRLKTDNAQLHRLVGKLETDLNNQDVTLTSLQVENQNLKEELSKDTTSHWKRQITELQQEIEKCCTDNLHLTEQMSVVKQQSNSKVIQIEDMFSNENAKLKHIIQQLEAQLQQADVDRHSRNDKLLQDNNKLYDQLDQMEAEKRLLLKCVPITDAEVTVIQCTELSYNRSIKPGDQLTVLLSSGKHQACSSPRPFGRDIIWSERIYVTVVPNLSSSLILELHNTSTQLVIGCAVFALTDILCHDSHNRKHVNASTKLIDANGGYIGTVTLCINYPIHSSEQKEKRLQVEQQDQQLRELEQEIDRLHRKLNNSESTQDMRDELDNARLRTRALEQQYNDAIDTLNRKLLHQDNIIESLKQQQQHETDAHPTGPAATTRPGMEQEMDSLKKQLQAAIIERDSALLKEVSGRTQVDTLQQENQLLKSKQGHSSLLDKSVLSNTPDVSNIENSNSVVTSIYNNLDLKIQLIQQQMQLQELHALKWRHTVDGITVCNKSWSKGITVEIIQCMHLACLYEDANGAAVPDPKHIRVVMAAVEGGGAVVRSQPILCPVLDSTFIQCSPLHLTTTAPNSPGPNAHHEANDSGVPPTTNIHIEILTDAGTVLGSADVCVELNRRSGWFSEWVPLLEIDGTRNEAACIQLIAHGELATTVQTEIGLDNQIEVVHKKLDILQKQLLESGKESTHTLMSLREAVIDVCREHGVTEQHASQQTTTSSSPVSSVGHSSSRSTSRSPSPSPGPLPQLPPPPQKQTRTLKQEPWFEKLQMLYDLVTTALEVVHNEGSRSPTPVKDNRSLIGSPTGSVGISTASPSPSHSTVIGTLPTTPTASMGSTYSGMQQCVTVNILEGIRINSSDNSGKVYVKIRLDDAKESKFTQPVPIDLQNNGKAVFNEKVVFRTNTTQGDIHLTLISSPNNTVLGVATWSLQAIAKSAKGVSQYLAFRSDKSTGGHIRVEGEIGSAQNVHDSPSSRAGYSMPQTPPLTSAKQLNTTTTTSTFSPESRSGRSKAVDGEISKILTKLQSTISLIQSQVVSTITQQQHDDHTIATWLKECRNTQQKYNLAKTKQTMQDKEATKLNSTAIAHMLTQDGSWLCSTMLGLLSNIEKTSLNLSVVHAEFLRAMKSHHTIIAPIVYGCGQYIDTASHNNSNNGNIFTHTKQTQQEEEDWRVADLYVPRVVEMHNAVQQHIVECIRGIQVDTFNKNVPKQIKLSDVANVSFNDIILQCRDSLVTGSQCVHQLIMHASTDLSTLKYEDNTKSGKIKELQSMISDLVDRTDYMHEAVKVDIDDGDHNDDTKQHRSSDSSSDNSSSDDNTPHQKDLRHSGQRQQQQPRYSTGSHRSSASHGSDSMVTVCVDHLYMNSFADTNIPLIYNPNNTLDCYLMLQIGDTVYKTSSNSCANNKATSYQQSYDFDIQSENHDTLTVVLCSQSRRICSNTISITSLPLHTVHGTENSGEGLDVILKLECDNTVLTKKCIGKLKMNVAIKPGSDTLRLLITAKQTVTKLQSSCKLVHSSLSISSTESLVLYTCDHDPTMFNIWRLADYLHNCLTSYCSHSHTAKNHKSVHVLPLSDSDHEGGGCTKLDWAQNVWRSVQISKQICKEGRQLMTALKKLRVAAKDNSVHRMLDIAARIDDRAKEQQQVLCFIVDTHLTAKERLRLSTTTSSNNGGTPRRRTSITSLSNEMQPRGIKFMSGASSRTSSTTSSCSNSPVPQHHHHMIGFGGRHTPTNSDRGDTPSSLTSVDLPGGTPFPRTDGNGLLHGVGRLESEEGSVTVSSDKGDDYCKSSPTGGVDRLPHFHRSLRGHEPDGVYETDEEEQSDDNESAPVPDMHVNNGKQPPTTRHKRGHDSGSEGGSDYMLRHAARSHHRHEHSDGSDREGGNKKTRSQLAEERRKLEAQLKELEVQAETPRWQNDSPF